MNFGGISLLHELGMLQIPHNFFKIHAASAYTNVLVILALTASVYTNVLDIFALTGSYLLNVRMLRHPKPTYWLHVDDDWKAYPPPLFRAIFIPLF